MFFSPDPFGRFVNRTSERPSHIEPVVGFNTGSDQIPRSCNEVIHQKQKELSDTGGSTCASMDALFYPPPQKKNYESIHQSRFRIPKAW